MIHMRQLGLPLVIAAALGGACGGSAESSRGAAGKAAADSAAAVAAAAAAERRVSNVMIGSRIGPGGRVIEPTFQFTPADTVYVSVATAGGRGADTLTAAWRFQSGEILQQSTEHVRPAGENTTFQLSRPKGLKPGTYKVVLFLGPDSADTRVFVVKK